MFQDFCHDAFGLLQHVVIPEAQDAVALVLQKQVALLVVGLLIGVLSAVQFYDESGFDRDKVHDVVSNGILAAEFDVVKSSRPQVSPQAPLGVCHVLAQFAGVVL